MTAPLVTYPGVGTPVQHKRRRRLTNGYTYDSLGCVLSPRGQLVFRRRDHRGKSCLVEGDNLALWDAMARVRSLARALKRLKQA